MKFLRDQLCAGLHKNSKLKAIDSSLSIIKLCFLVIACEHFRPIAGKDVFSANRAGSFYRGSKAK